MKTERIEVRVQPTEKAGFEQAADMSGLALSAWARARLRQAAIMELQQAGLPIPFIAPVNLKDSYE